MIESLAAEVAFVWSVPGVQRHVVVEARHGDERFPAERTNVGFLVRLEMVCKLIGRPKTFPTNCTDAWCAVQMTVGVSDQAPRGVPEPTHLTGLSARPLLHQLPGRLSFSRQKLVRIWFPLVVLLCDTTLSCLFVWIQIFL